MNPPFVMVRWKDAWVDGSDTVGVNDPDPKHQATLMETVGWLLQDTPEGVSLFNERCVDAGSDLYRSRTMIPRELILSVTPFTLTKRRAKRAPESPHPPG